MVYFADTLSGILDGYYSQARQAGCVVHCTAKFCGGGRAEGAKTYHAQQIVQDSVGRAFMLEISSVCFSPRTVGARVTLSKDQLPLVDKPEERDWDGKQSRSAAAGDSGGAWRAAAIPREKERSPGERSGSSPAPSGKHAKGGKKKPAKPKQDNAGVCGGSENRPSSPPSKRDLEPAFTKPVAKGRGRSTHITLGCAQGFGSRETNFDMLRLCDMEASSAATDADFVRVTGGRARYFGDGVCCVYFAPPLRVSTLYSGFY